MNILTIVELRRESRILEKKHRKGGEKGWLETAQEWILQWGERGKMRLLMESAPREHEKRTLFAHLECRDVCVCVCSYLNPCEKQTSSHFVGPHIYKRGHFRLSGQG